VARLWRAKEQVTLGYGGVSEMIQSAPWIATIKTARAQTSLRRPVETCQAKSLGSSSFTATDSRFGPGTDRPLNGNI
jgi:hypothetical protein